MKKKIKKLIILLFFIIILLVILVGFIVKLKNENYQQKKLEAKKGETYEYYEGKIFPSGIHKLKYLYTQYGGTLEHEILYEQLYSLCQYLPNLYEEIKLKDDDEILEYYKENSDYIFENIGFKDKDLFKKLVEELKKIDCEKLGEYKNSSINLDSVTFDENVCNFNISIGFTEYEDKIVLKTYMNKTRKNLPLFKEIYFEMN